MRTCMCICIYIYTRIKLIVASKCKHGSSADGQDTMRGLFEEPPTAVRMPMRMVRGSHVVREVDAQIVECSWISKTQRM